MGKVFKGIFRSVGLLLAVVLFLFLVVYAVIAVIGAATYGEARKAREFVLKIPAIHSGFAPQGLAYSEETDTYILTGYDTDNTVLLYLVQDGESRRVSLTDEEGAPLKGHAGGVTCHENTVFISDNASLYLFSLNELIAAQKTDKVAVKRTVPVDNNASYCYSDDKYLYVGEFCRAENYKTDESHHYTTPNGDTNRAIVSVYPLRLFELTSLLTLQPYPEYCISVTGLVQGFAVKDGTYILSRSYGLTDSRLEYHTGLRDTKKKIPVTFKQNETAPKAEVPLYFLDSASNYKTLILPAFSEDVTIVGERVLVTNEASANKYFVGKLFGANKVYSYPVYEKTVK